MSEFTITDLRRYLTHLLKAEAPITGIGAIDITGGKPDDDLPEAPA